MINQGSGSTLSAFLEVAVGAAVLYFLYLIWCDVKNTLNS
jgi:hypothetical protein